VEKERERGKERKGESGGRLKKKEVADEQNGTGSEGGKGGTRKSERGEGEKKGGELFLLELDYTKILLLKGRVGGEGRKEKKAKSKTAPYKEKKEEVDYSANFQKRADFGQNLFDTPKGKHATTKAALHILGVPSGKKKGGKEAKAGKRKEGRKEVLSCGDCGWKGF